MIDELKQAIICDVDRTLLFPSPETYPAHLAPAFKLNKSVWELCQKFIVRDYQIIFLTCRAEEMREKTSIELVKYFNEPILLMRKDSDCGRPDEETKEEIYLRDIKPYWNVIYALDDKPRINEMWKRHGITPLNFFASF